MSTPEEIQLHITQHQRRFRASVSTWRKCANHLESLLSDSEEVAALKRGRSDLVDAMSHLSETHCELENMLPTGSQDRVSNDRYEAVEEANHQLIKKTCERIIQLEVDRSEMGSTVSSRSHYSRRSSGSRGSSILNRASVATEAAAIRAKLKFADLEANKRAELEWKKAELEKVNAMKELHVAEAKIEAMDKAQYDNCFEIEGSVGMVPQEEKRAYVEEYLESHTPTGNQPIAALDAHDNALAPAISSTFATQQTSSSPTRNLPNGDISTIIREPAVSAATTCLNPFASDFRQEYISPNTSMTTADPQSTVVNSGMIPAAPPTFSSQSVKDAQNLHEAQTSPKAETPVSDPQQQMSSFAECLAKQFNINRLPPPEPGVFVGDPLKYPNWKSAFETLIEQRGIPPAERLHYLKKYIGGSAKQAVEGYFFLTTDDAFAQAKKLLEKRYGDPFVIGNAFRDKLDSWPKVPHHDGKALRSLADFMRQCRAAMENIGHLGVLNDEREHRKILAKLPDWLINRWARKVSERKGKEGKYPSFNEFSKFIEEEADIACDPMTSLQGIKGLATTDTNKHGHSKTRPPGASSFATGANETPHKYNPTEKSTPIWKECALCGRGHHLDTCRSFLSMTMEERKEFVKKKGLCFGCLNQGHISKHCRKRLACKTCSKRHPTSLHGDVKETNKLTANTTASMTVTDPQPDHKSVSSNTRVSLLSGIDDSGKSSMTVPVWVSHRDNPEVEKLVYALLDTQSDTTFVLESTCIALGVNGTEVQLLLSTMFAKDQRVTSCKINGLMVRGYDSQLTIPLPAAYSRGVMPANRSHIPTPDMARKWPHLERIADFLMPLTDCEIGLLIGYNCSRALAPRDVIPPTDNGPFAQKTDLGWGIVGVVDHTQGEPDASDAIGVSHRVLTCEVPSALTPSNRKVKTADSQDHVQISFRTRVKEIINPFDVAKMMELDFSERTTNDKSLSRDDTEFLRRMEKGIHQQPDGHFVMPLPFKKSEPPDLQKNEVLALHRLKQLKARFKKSPKYHLDYCTFMRNIIEKGYAEQVPDSEQKSSNNGHIWYIPHHGIYHAKKPEKIRIVFDCSARCHGDSLNDHLLQGPDLTNALVGVLCRFRREHVAIICDVEQMFFQFKVDKQHRDFLRFLWWENGNYDTEPTSYRMKVHLFGAVSSPGCANFGLKKIANDYEAEFGTAAADFVKRNFYVDDGLAAVPTVEEAINLITQTRKLCARGGLHLHKFVSNSRAVLDTVAVEDRAKGITNLDLSHDTLPIERALGVQWCIESDTFQFRIIMQDRPLTRRGVLSTICSVYDPLGFVAPTLLIGKQILQSLCKEEAGWDDPLPDSTKRQWERWRTDLHLLENLKVRRCFKPGNFGHVKSVEIHHFSDASTVGYSQCSYLRLIDVQDGVHCSLIMGKARVCPLKLVTVPRLELNAAVVSVRVSALLKKELEYENPTEVFWTDSKVVLGYIANDARRFHVFVANRVQQIRNHTEPSQWRHVTTDINPADDGSRGITAEELVNKSRWLKGPEFLWEKEIPIVMEAIKPTITQDDPEVKKVQAMAASTSGRNFELERLECFSEWHRAKRAVAASLRLKSRFRDHSIKKPCEAAPIQALRRNVIPAYEPVMVEDLRRAEIEIIRLVQRNVFAEEVKVLQSLGIHDSNIGREIARQRNTVIKKTSSLYRLDPFIDADGLIRVGGRIKRSQFTHNFKHPVILPRKHHVTDMVIHSCHQQVAHQGRGMTTNQLRATGFWIIGCSSAVSHFISSCVKCRKLYGKVLEQKMADLPEDRLQPAPPFTYCGVDLFGPWCIKEGRSEVKRYGVLFTCMASRAIHIETTASLSTDSFISALRRFLSIRGPIRQLRSDRGTNFVGARTELDEAVTEMNLDHVKRFLLKEGCDQFEFKMNAPSASHAGGVWERQIRSVRRVLASLMDQAGSQINDESLRTLMCEAAAIVNSRPLTVDNLNDPTSLEPLTPNHLLTMKSKVILPPPGAFQQTDLYSRKQWRRVQQLANEFWTRWRKEFVQNLQTRQKWVRPSSEFHVGDIVIIRDDNLPRNQWHLARIEEVFPGKDNLVRRVKLVVGDPHLDANGKKVLSRKYLERPIQKLVLLVTDGETREVPAEEP